MTAPLIGFPLWSRRTGVGAQWTFGTYGVPAGVCVSRFVTFFTPGLLF